MECQRSNDGRKLDAQSKEALRIRAVEQILEGQSPEAMARVLGINQRSVFRWLERYHYGGWEALRNRPKSGRPPKLTGEQLRWLSGVLRKEAPEQYRFPFALWTRDMVRSLIREQLGVRLSAASVGRILKTLGFTPQRPLHRAQQRQPELVDQWQNEVYPELQKRAQAEGAKIFFADESGIRSDYHTGTTWAPKGQTPVVETTGSRLSVKMISAISPSGELRFMAQEGSVTADVFGTFVKRLAGSTEAKIFLIVDGHPVHRAKKVQRVLEELDHRIELFFLPPYAPDLNPDELVWGHVKGRIGRWTVTIKEELKKQVWSALRSLQQWPSKIRGFFQHPSCQYAQLG